MVVTFIFVLCIVPPLITSSKINAANGCSYDVVPNENFKYTFRIAGGLSFTKDCPEQHVFDKKACGCIKDSGDTHVQDSNTGFQTTAKADQDLASTTPSPDCKFRENPNDEFSYMEETNQGWKPRPCGNGTKFQLSPFCNCIHWDLVSPICHPEVEIGSSDGIVKGYGSISRYDVPIKANNVHIDSMGFDFDGSSEIKIDLFNDLDFAKGFTITFEFMESSTVTERQVLFTNCDIRTTKSSIEFALMNGYVTFIINVGGEKNIAKNIEFQHGGFKKVTAMYDGNQLTAYVGNKMGTLDKPGVIRNRLSPMRIGNTECPGSSGFKGTLRGIKIYRCVKDDGSIIP